MASSSSVLTAILCCSFFLQCLATPTLRIMGGTEVESIPYMVSVRRNSVHVCGGSLIKPEFVLTAAHCVSNVGTTPIDEKDISVRYGTKNQFAGGSISNVLKIFIHSEYGSFLHDVALLKIPPVQLSSKVNVIEVAGNPDAVQPGSSVSIAGWGSTEIGGKLAVKLHQGEATVLDASKCNEEINYGYTHCMCLSHNPGSGTCNGDAGSPAVYKNKLVGIANFVIGSCGTKFPDVFARASYYNKWIQSVIDAESL